MTKQASKVPITNIPLDPESPTPMYLQLYRGLQEAILQRRFGAGMRLPSTRVLAQELGVSRNTVLQAFNQLLAEGYLDGKIGSGTYVVESLPDETLQKRAAPQAVDSGKYSYRISKRGRLLGATRVSSASTMGRAPVPFRPGMPAVDRLSFDLWMRRMAQKGRDLSAKRLLGYAEPAGYGPLREEIAAYLAGARAVRCEPEQVLVVSGSQQALDLIARVLLDPGDSVMMEDPGYIGARAAMIASGAKVVPVPIDPEGLDLAAGLRKAKQARLAYVTPSHQFPLGVVMSLSRRLALLEWAETRRTWIIEDDYDSEYRYRGRPLSSLQGLDASGRVIYTGTFSKVLFPALRLGFMVVPKPLVHTFISARAILDRHSPTLEQAALADLLHEGEFVRHIRRMRILYESRQKALLGAARAHLSGVLELSPDEAGMHLVGWLPKGLDALRASDAAAKQGVDVPALDHYAIRRLPRSGFLLGYTAWNETELSDAAETLGKVLRDLCRI